MTQDLLPEILPLVLKTGGALLVMIAVIIAMFFIAKRFSVMQGGQDEIKITGAKYQSPKEKLILVEVMGKKLLLGITPGKIEKIESFDVEITSDVKDASSGINRSQANDTDSRFCSGSSFKKELEKQSSEKYNLKNGQE